MSFLIIKKMRVSDCQLIICMSKTIREISFDKFRNSDNYGLNRIDCLFRIWLSLKGHSVTFSLSLQVLLLANILGTNGFISAQVFYLFIAHFHWKECFKSDSNFKKNELFMSRISIKEWNKLSISLAFELSISFFIQLFIGNCEKSRTIQTFLSNHFPHWKLIDWFCTVIFNPQFRED